VGGLILATVVAAADLWTGGHVAAGADLTYQFRP
jgi:hypothetical protein